MLKKTKIKILALIAATVQAASLLSGCSLFPAEEEPSVPALKTPQPIEYSFYRVKEDTLRSTGSPALERLPLFITQIIRSHREEERSRRSM